MGLDIDPETEITVTCGSTEGMIAGMMATVDAGEEVVVFEPFYENYAPDAILSDAKPRHVPLCERRMTAGSLKKTNFAPRLTKKRKRLSSAIRTIRRAKFFRWKKCDLSLIYAKNSTRFVSPTRFTNILFTIQDREAGRLTTEDPKHICMATLDGMRERTVVVNSLSKTYSVTGWRVGYCIAPPDITGAIRKVHDFLTVGAANPLQIAGAYALLQPPSYYVELQQEYQRKRDFIIPILQNAGFKCDAPEGAYYVMTDISDFGFKDDIEFTQLSNSAKSASRSFRVRRFITIKV